MTQSPEHSDKPRRRIRWHRVVPLTFLVVVSLFLVTPLLGDVEIDLGRAQVAGVYHRELGEAALHPKRLFKTAAGLFAALSPPGFDFPPPVEHSLTGRPAMRCYTLRVGRLRWAVLWNP